jgi:acetyl-CoA carboxylase carboxyl transferase subunit alpha
MLQYSIYSVISPEGCASILFKSAARAAEAAEAMRITARDLYELKLIDEVVPEPLGGAHRDSGAVMNTRKQKLSSNLERLRHTPMTKLLAQRHSRLMAYGAYQTVH